MKTFILTILLALVASLCEAQAFYTITNPPAAVQARWTASPSPGVTNYNVYYGTASQQYNIRLAAGNATSLNISNLLRGVTYFFAYTAQAQGLESSFSSEVSIAIPGAPAPPGALPILLLWDWSPSMGIEWSNVAFIIHTSPRLDVCVEAWDVLDTVRTNRYPWYIDLNNPAMFFRRDGDEYKRC